MPLSKLQLRPGINTVATQLANEGGWSLSNRIRWKSDGVQRYLEKLGGWTQLIANTMAGTVRALFAYQDLATNKNLLIGGDGGLQAYVVPTGGSASLINFKLARKIDATTYADPNVDTFSGTSGSAVITIHDVAHGAANGDTVYIPVPISIGNRTINPQIVTVAVTDADHWTFTNAQSLTANANTSGNFGTVPKFSVTASEINTNNVRVVFPAHGLSNGNNFTVHYAVVWQNYIPTVALNAGTYSVTVLDSNTFTVNSGILQTALGNGAEQGFDPAQSAGTIHGNENLVYFRSGTLLGSPTGHWWIDNFGGSVIAGLGGGPMYAFTPPVAVTGAQAIALQVANAPVINGGTLVAMPQAQVVAWASESVINSGVQDPLMLRWSDAGNINTWIASATNQAGSFRLSSGSAIVGARRVPQTILVWTDVELWSMSYIGPPFVYSINVIGSECGLIGPRAYAVLGRNTVWMTQKSFFMFGDGGVTLIDCPLWDTIFPNLHTNAFNLMTSRVFGYTNAPFGEVGFFYPSATGNGECDSYVKWRIADGPNGWDYGSLSRSSWLGISVFGMPLATDFAPRIQQHETGFDDNGSAMSGVFAETGFFDLADGDQIPFVKEIIPDIKWSGTGGSMSFTFWGQNESTDSPVMFGPYTVTPSTKRMPVRTRIRQIAFRADWAALTGYSARLGALRVRMQGAGRRP